MKNKLTMKYPAAWWGARWRDAVPAGNGAISAAVYGAVRDETVLLNHEDLWHRVVTPELPDVSDKLPEVRDLLAKEDFFKAERVLADEFKRRGYHPHSGNPLPLGDLKIKMPLCEGFRDYRRALDMETGEVTVDWKDGESSYRRSLFVSRPEDLIVMEVGCENTTLDLDVTLDLHDREDNVFHARGQIAKFPEYLEVKADDAGWIRYAAHNDDDTDFGAVARVVPFPQTGAGGSEEPPVMVAKNGKIQIKNAGSVLVVIKLFVRGKRKSAWAGLIRELEDTVMDYQALFAPHAMEHGELFSRMSLDLGGEATDHALSNEELLLNAYQGEASTALVEKMWAFGRYLLICSSRPGGMPCPLLGKWCGEYVGFWAFHMVNENLQMIYWQALSGNLSETLLPVFDYFEGALDDF